MKHLMLAALLGTLALPGCVATVERRTTHSSPPPPPQATVSVAANVSVEWNDARVVFLREYYGCDWDDVGLFEYYETRHGIPEDDLFVLFYVSRRMNQNFHEVVFTYESCGRSVFEVTRRCRFPVWDLYVDLPRGTWCPPAYARAYGFYWDRNDRVVLTNYDCHALFWLRFSVNYYGWSHQDVFTRWERCVTSGDRFTVVIHREYQYAGRGNRNFLERPVARFAERPERGEEFRRQIRVKRVEVVKKVEIDVNVRVKRGQPVARPLSKSDLQGKAEDRRRENEKEREHEKKELERTKHERPERDKDARKDDRKDDKKDDSKDPPPPPKRTPPPKDDERNDRRDDKKDDKKDDRKDEKKDDKKDGKDNDRKNDRKDDRKDDKRNDD